MLIDVSERPQNHESVGILGYLIVSNKQIHSYQMELLDDYLKEMGIGYEETPLPDIIDGKENALSFSSVYMSFKSEKHEVKKNILYMLVALSFVDGIIDENERFIINQVISDGAFLNEETDLINSLAIKEADKYRNSKNLLFEKPCEQSLKDNFFVYIWKCIVSFFKKLFKRGEVDASEDGENEYIKAIEGCARVAFEDFNKVKPAYKSIIECGESSIREIHTYKNSLYLENGLAAEVAKIIGDFADALEKNVLEQTKIAGESLNQKERTIPDFTISLIGRTKSGKSTLHSILTRQGEDKIGTGKQRTTRYNRVYQWNLLRLIDTPGIGSAEAGGRTDDEIAEGVLGESDIICFVVIDDSILQDVLEFIERVATLNKPIVILLNHKENITSDVKYRRFLSNPTDWIDNNGECRLTGHINRIMTYAKDRNFDNLINVYPVFLLAAQLAGNENYVNDSRLLWESSNIDSFIEQLKIWITVAGSIKRSQTIIDETISIFNKSENEIAIVQKPIKDETEKLIEQQSKKIEMLKSIELQTIERLKSILEEKFLQLTSQEAFVFAEKVYDKKIDINEAWRNYIEEIDFEGALKLLIETEISSFSQKLDETVSDFFMDFYYSINTKFQLNQIKIPIDLDFRSITRLLGSSIGVAGSIVLFVLGTSNPIGWILTIVGVAVGFGANLFSSREKRRKTAIANIQKDIKAKVEEQSPAQIECILTNLEEELLNRIKLVDNLFGDLIEGMRNVVELSNDIFITYNQQIEYLNRMYACRLIQFLKNELDEDGGYLYEANIKSVDRSQKGKIIIGCENFMISDTSKLQGIIAEEVIIKEVKNYEK